MINQHVVDRYRSAIGRRRGRIFLQPTYPPVIKLLDMFHYAAVKKRFRHDLSIVSTNSELIQLTFLFLATISPVRYSAR